MLLKLKFPLMNEAGGDGAAAGGGDTPPAPDAPPPASPPSSTLAGGNGDQPSALDAVIPEKFLVKKDDGSLDLEATVRKLAPSYKELEKTRGQVEKAPDTPDGYEPKVEIEGFKWDEVKADPKMQSFLKRMHAKGITNAQLGDILSEYYQAAPELAGAGQALTAEECTAQLKDVWKTDAEFTAGTQAAFKAFNAFAEKAGVTLQQLEESGAADNPYVLRLLAAIAPELKEDRTPNNSTTTPGGDDIQTLMQSEAYTNPKHPDHAKVSKQIQEHYAKKFGSAPAL